MVLTNASRRKVWERTNEKQQINFLFSYLNSNPLALVFAQYESKPFLRILPLQSFPSIVFSSSNSVPLQHLVWA